METSTIILIDDAPGLASALTVSGCGYDCHNIVESSRLPLEEAQRILKGAQVDKDSIESPMINGRALAAIGLNVNLRKNQAQAARAECSGLELFEWLRLERRMTIPVVLWSFLEPEQLRREGPPAWALPKGHVFRRLPASVREIQTAFEAVLANEARLSSSELHRMLGDLYGAKAIQQNPLEQMSEETFSFVAGRIKALEMVIGVVSESVLRGCDRLETGNSAELLGSLENGPAWQELRASARALDHDLRTAGSRVPEVEELNSAAVAIESFLVSHRLAPASSADFERAAAFYRSQLRIVQNMLRQLVEWTQDVEAGTAE